MSRFAHCEKCDHLTLKTRLHPVQVCRQTHDSPAEYEDWCGPCCGYTSEDEPYERQRGDDDGVEYGHPGDRLAGRE
jgi:hypothetical protein